MIEMNVEEIKMWPKVELHVHLDTSLLKRTVDRLTNGISEARFKTYFSLPEKCLDLHHFLSFVEPGIQLLQTKKALEVAIDELVADQQRENVIYTEIRLAPILHTRESMSHKEVVDVVCRAVEKAEKRYGVVVRQIHCTMRHFSKSESVETATVALEYKRDGIVGFDLAGDEAGFLLDEHIEAFDMVHQAGLSATCHAGEARGVDSINDALDNLHVSRMGHGVRAIEDNVTIERLMNNGIHLEICPTSNIVIDVFENMSAHSIDRLYNAGVSTSINTDGRGLFDTTLTNEYYKIAQVFGWEPKDFLKVNTMAVEAAFCDEKTKKRLSANLNTSMRYYL